MFHAPDVHFIPRYDTQFCIALLTMERLFSPCTGRLYDLLESQGEREELRNHLTELLHELNLDVSAEAFLSTERAFTYDDLFAMLGNGMTLAWLTPHAAVAHVYGQVLDSWWYLNESCSCTFIVDDKAIEALARSPEHLVEICDVVLRLLAASVVHSVQLIKENSRDGVLVNAPSLANLMEQCQSLKAVTLQNLEMNENLIRELGAYSRPDLEIVLVRCHLTNS
jgi:hypothetical protein